HGKQKTSRELLQYKTVAYETAYKRSMSRSGLPSIETVFEPSMQATMVLSKDPQVK
ncbi:jg27848, partial [Pararge aegeria aegeria]